MSRRSSLSLLAAVSAIVSIAPAAWGQGRSRIGFRAEIGGGTTLHDFTAPDVGLHTPVVTAHARFPVYLVDALSIQLGVGLGRLFQRRDESSTGAHAYFDMTLGLRLAPLWGAVRPWVDVNGGAFLTDNRTHGGVDGGIGLEFGLSPAFSLGPYGRFTYVFDGYRRPDPVNPQQVGQTVVATANNPRDISFWQAGLAMTFRPLNDPPPPPPAPADTDRDGVNDPDDQCPSVPAGDHPDPARRGCPASDTDRDGVMDPDDQCVSEPAGDHPDTERRGCPLSDEDHDGVYGREDQCPAVAMGDHPDPDRRGCPDGDQDHDGVLDHADQCRTEPAGLRPDPARAGCPAPDRDHDNVPDAVDHCPDQPGAPSTNPQRNGCPGLVLVQEGQVRINRPVFFATSRDTILATSFPVLRAVAEALREIPEIRHVSIEGHTDDVGEDEANLELSRRRAASVVQWLTTTGQIEGGRLTSTGYGETRPLVEGRTSRSRAANRRVEFRILGPGDVVPQAVAPATTTPAAPPTTTPAATPPAAPPAAPAPPTTP